MRETKLTKVKKRWETDYYNFLVNNGMTNHGADQTIYFTKLKISQALSIQRKEIMKEVKKYFCNKSFSQICKDNNLAPHVVAKALLMKKFNFPRDSDKKEAK